MDAGSLRPLGLGEILDVAINVYRRRFGAMAKVVAVFVVPVYVLATLVQLSILPDDEAAASGEFWTFVAGLVVTLVIILLGTEFATAAAFRIVSGTYLGEDVGWRDSLRFTMARFGPLCLVALLSWGGIFLGSLLLVLPGIYLYGLWAVAVPALLFEDARGRRALGRSRVLVEGRWWPVFGTLVLATVLAGIVGNIVAVVVQLVVPGDIVGSTLGSIASGVVTTPFVAAVTIVLYYDLRVRKEGFDLELLAHRWDG